MRHRICSYTGLGNPEEPLLKNTGNLNTEFGDDVIKNYFDKWRGVDYTVTEDKILVGVEPTYQYDPFKIICLDKNKSESYIENGQAKGGYGTDVVSVKKKYSDYHPSSHFVKFVDKWHSTLFTNN